MENAVQALLIVAGVLVGLMILSLGISLYSSLNGYVEQTQQEIANRETQQFNEQFLKYINCNDGATDVEFVLTIQDIVTAANTAYENNLKYGLTSHSPNNYYVTININSGESNLETTINSKSAEILENALGNEYKCSTSDVKINANTGRVYEVNFSKVIP